MRVGWIQDVVACTRAVERSAFCIHTHRVLTAEARETAHCNIDNTFVRTLKLSVIIVGLHDELLAPWINGTGNSVNR